VKILALGNSHVGSLKRAWDSIQHGFPETRVHFVAARGYGLSRVRIEGRSLHADDSSLSQSIRHTYGSPVVDLDELEPDVVLFYGMGLGLQYGFVGRVKMGEFSASFLEHSWSDLANKWGWALARKVASISSVPCFAGSPIVSAPGVIPEGVSQASYEKVEGALKIFQESFLEGLGLNYVLQPLETFDPEKMRSYSLFSEDSKRLAIGTKNDNEIHPPTDYGHMNDEFGELYLRHFLEDIVVSD